MKKRNIHLSNYISNFINERKLSARQLALLSGLEHASIGQYIRGERLPRISSLIYLTKAMAKIKGTDFKEEIYTIIKIIEKDI
tara:strand:- start:314 stop:562 length:249 start_codon:yes stop_codon:yes gene_type:complete